MRAVRTSSKPKFTSSTSALKPHGDRSRFLNRCHAWIKRRHRKPPGVCAEPAASRAELREHFWSIGGNRAERVRRRAASADSRAPWSSPPATTTSAATTAAESAAAWSAGRAAWRTSSSRSPASGTAAATEIEVTRHRAHVILARIETPDAKSTLVVGLRGAGWHKLSIALRVLIAHDLHADPGHRIAGFVHHVAGDDAAARQGEIDAAELLAVAKLQRCPSLKRSALPVRQRDKSGLRHVDRIAPRGQLCEFVRALRVGQGPPTAR